MPRFQFSLRALLGATAFVAVACSTLLYASGTIASVVFTVTVIVLLAAIVAALFRQGTARAFWVGFAIFGWSYVWLVQWPNPNTGLGIPAGAAVGLQEHQGLATTKLMSFTYHALLPLVRTPPSQPWQPYAPVYWSSGAPVVLNPPAVQVAPDGSVSPVPPLPSTGSGGPYYAPAPPPVTPAPVPTTSSYPSYFAFMHVGHSLWAWLFALFGALLARHFYRTREKKPQTGSPPAAS